MEDSARQLQQLQRPSTNTTTVTGNLIDDCWRSDPGWPSNRQHLADCSSGFGCDALGDKGGEIYVVTDPSDSANLASPLPGTLPDTGLGCLSLHQVTNIIIHNVQIHHCKPSGNVESRISPTEVVERGGSDGDGITMYGSGKIWIDHCFLSYCTDAGFPFGGSASGVNHRNYSSLSSISPKALLISFLVVFAVL